MAYDAHGHRTTLQDSGDTTTYAFSARNEVTRVSLPGSLVITYTYDAVGNMSVKHHQALDPLTFTYDAGSRITTLQDGPTLVTYTFDDNGSMTVENRGGVSTNYSYDRENRLKGITHPDATLSTYTYDGDGLRRTRQEPGESVHTLVWDGSDYLMEY